VAINRDLPFNLLEFKEFSPYATLQEIVCGKSYGGIGVSVAPDSDGSTRVIEVLIPILSKADSLGIPKSPAT
jgi:hypothetical protein